MAKTNLGKFREEVSAAVAEAESATTADRRKVLADARAVSCTPSGVASIWAAAILEAMFDGFPAEIDLSSPNGYNDGVVLARTPEGWTVDRVRNESRFIDTVGQPWITHYAGPALKAMGIPFSSQAHKMLLEKLKWRPGLLQEASEAVPAWVVAATVGHGSSLPRMFSASCREQAMFEDLASVVRAKGCDLSSPPQPRVTPPLITLARSGAADFIWFGFSERLLKANVDHNGWTAAMAAVQDGDLDTVRALYRNGERMDVMDPAGNTLLHMAADRGGPESIEVADYLAFMGVDQEVRNRAGYTAMDCAWSKDTEFAEMFEAVVRRHAAPKP